MLPLELKKTLCFYFITDDSAPACDPVNQVKIALQAGATIIQYRNKSFSPQLFEQVVAIRDLCKANLVPLIINDNILLAKAVSADGIHLGQNDENPAIAGRILGSQAIVGLSVSNLDELKKTDLSACDYIGTGPVFPTQTKKDAKKVCGLSGLKAVAEKSSLPVVAIGGIDGTNARSCFMHGAAGVAVISSITRAKDPVINAQKIGSACGCSPRFSLDFPWNDEFILIKKLLKNSACGQSTGSYIKVPPGDDACLLDSIAVPVITTDTQKEGVHFRLDWQTPEEIGCKAVAVTLSDLAASFAVPVSLFVNLSLPEYISDNTVNRLYQGINKALLQYCCTLGGGNISKADQLALDLFAVGSGTGDIFPTRSSALPGDGLYCTGPLGLARAGLELLIKKDPEFKGLINKFKFPAARFDAAKILAENSIRCVIDVSDGLFGDAGHIAEASNISIEFDLQAYDFDPLLVLYCKKYNLAPEEMILAGGEDYELLFTCKPWRFEIIKTALPDAFKIGRCVPFTGKHIINPLPGVSSFQHGKKEIVQ